MNRKKLLKTENKTNLDQTLTIRYKSKSEVTSCAKEVPNWQSSLPTNSVQYEDGGVKSGDLNGNSQYVVKVHALRETCRVDWQTVVHKRGGDPPYRCGTYSSE